MFDCPKQYQTSPNVTPVIFDVPVQPLVQAAVTEKEPPAAVGRKNAFQSLPVIVAATVYAGSESPESDSDATVTVTAALPLALVPR